MTERIEEMARLSPEAESLDGSFWDRRAERFAANTKPADAASDHLLRRLIRVTSPASTVIDAGAGTGRYALPLARRVARVTAVDPSAGMLGILLREAERAGIENVTTVHAGWEEAAVDPADVVFSSFVLPMVADAHAFLAKLDAAAREHVFLYLGAYSGDAVLDPLWRHFHDAPRAPGASHLDALAVLRELGIEPDVRPVEIPNRKRYASAREAVEHYREALLLADTPEIRDELEGLLGAWLLGRRGSLRSPLRTIAAAIVHWPPRGAERPEHGRRAAPRAAGRPAAAAEQA